MMPDGSGQQSRRMYDDILPVVMLQVEEKLRDTRHEMRKEMAALAANVVNGQSQASREHEAVRTDIADLKRCVEDLAPLPATVRELRDQSLAQTAHDAAIDALMRTARWGFGAVLAVITAATAVLALIAH